MTLSKTKADYLSKEEWNELDALRKAINYNPSQVSPQKMEKFTELFVRSLQGKGDTVPPQTDPTNY